MSGALSWRQTSRQPKMRLPGCRASWRRSAQRRRRRSGKPRTLQPGWRWYAGYTGWQGSWQWAMAVHVGWIGWLPCLFRAFCQAEWDCAVPQLSPDNVCMHMHCALPCSTLPCLPLQLQLDIGHLHSALNEEREAATRADGQPSRSRHQADLAVAALRALREEEAELAAQLRVQEAAEAAQLQARWHACMHAWRSTLHYLHIACWSHGGGGGSTAAPAVVLPHTPLAWLPICLSPCLSPCLPACCRQRKSFCSSMRRRSEPTTACARRRGCGSGRPRRWRETSRWRR